LAFNKKPDYDYLHNLFHKLFINKGHQYGHPFVKCIMSNSLCDWTIGSREKMSRQKVLQEKDVPLLWTKVCTFCLDSMLIL
jgi:hypothetical protein